MNCTAQTQNHRFDICKHNRWRRWPIENGSKNLAVSCVQVKMLSKTASSRNCPGLRPGGPLENAKVISTAISAVAMGSCRLHFGRPIQQAACSDDRRFEVFYTDRSRADLLRLHEFMLQRAETIERLDDADDAVSAIESAIGGQLRHSLLFVSESGKKSIPAEVDHFIPGQRCVGLSGFIADSTVVVLAIRHQLEADYD